MVSAARYTAYDGFARIVNETWGIEVSEALMPDIEQLLLTKLSEKSQLLDLCCGAGHLAQKLIRKGYHVTGIDGSQAMLDYARANVPDGRFILEDARYFNLSSAFHGVVSTDYGLNHVLNIDELIRVFQNVYNALLPNGWFMFDLSLDQRYQSDWHNSMLGDVQEDYAWALKRSYDFERKIGTIYITIFQQQNAAWQRHDLSWQVKGYGSQEVISALESVEFTEVQFWEKQHSPESETKTAYFVCRK